MSCLLIYKEIESYTKCLEEKYNRSANQFLKLKTISKRDIEIDAIIDNHYKKILDSLHSIKKLVGEIEVHDSALADLIDTTNRVDKHYIKKQIEIFDNVQSQPHVSRRQNKPNRPRESSGFQELKCWDNFLDQKQKENPVEMADAQHVNKRKIEVRKHKKIVSSTFDNILDPNTLSFNGIAEEDESEISRRNSSSDPDYDDPEEIEENPHQPKIVGMLLKKEQPRD